MNFGIVTLVLYLMSGHEIDLRVPKEACEATMQALRDGSRVTVRDDDGELHEVERARCIFDLKGTIHETEPSS